MTGTHSQIGRLGWQILARLAAEDDLTSTDFTMYVDSRLPKGWQQSQVNTSLRLLRARGLVTRPAEKTVAEGKGRAYAWRITGQGREALAWRSRQGPLTRAGKGR